ncbi:MAG: hypothetical protein IJ106_06350 [Parasporobacterium sp.]|nr:hypothetical protein [Parasporobacterium sp.]
MDKYIPLSKKSKKEQKKYHEMQRHTWNGLNPVTRTVPNGKGYDRNKLKNIDRRNGREFRNDEPAVFVYGFIG